MKQKQFKLVNGRWQIGNLYDSLIASSFDFFINTHRELKSNIETRYRRFPLYVYNCQFKFKNR